MGAIYVWQLDSVNAISLVSFSLLIIWVILLIVVVVVEIVAALSIIIRLECVVTSNDYKKYLQVSVLCIAVLIRGLTILN